MSDKYLNYTQLQLFLNKLKENFASKSVATGNSNGLMAAADKSKLDKLSHETWTFELEDGSVVTKEVTTWNSQM